MVIINFKYELFPCEDMNFADIPFTTMLQSVDVINQFSQVNIDTIHLFIWMPLFVNIMIYIYCSPNKC